MARVSDIQCLPIRRAGANIGTGFGVQSKSEKFTFLDTLDPVGQLWGCFTVNCALSLWLPGAFGSPLFLQQQINDKQWAMSTGNISSYGASSRLMTLAPG